MARLALTSWFLPMLLGLIAAFSSAPAYAQAPIQTVVVLDFAVAPGLDPLLGRKAADAMAVELQRSGDFEVVTRQRVEQAVGQQAGLQPPFNDTAQALVAQAVGARSVFSGRVAAVDITPGRAARVRLEVKQLDAATGDYINGTGVTETTEQKLQTVANETLVDEAINKASFSAVRSVRQTTLPEGQVLNTTTEDVELSIGSREGVSAGQRYTVLRDVFNRAKQITERVKIGELTIDRVESNQSVGRLSRGGAAGIRTGDRIRKIFVTTNYPTSSYSADGNSVTPVTAPVVRSDGSGRGGLSGLARKSGRGLYGLAALAGLIVLAGAGGGGNSNSTPRVDDPTLANPDAVYPRANISFRSGFTGLGSNLQSESVVGFLIYRGPAGGFAADPDHLQAFVDGRNATSANQMITVSDPLDGSPLFTNTRVVTITSNAATTDGSGAGVTVSDVSGGTADTTVPVNSIIATPTVVTLNFTERRSEIGQQYAYIVQRLTAQRVQTTTTTTGSTTGTTQVQFQSLLSNASRVTGGFTPLVRPVVTLTSANTDDFSVRINFDPTPFNDITNGFTLPSNINVGTGVNQFRVQVSTSSAFTDATTFTSPDIPNPGTTRLGDITFDRTNGLGNIRVPGNIPGETPLFVRVLSRNTTDGNPVFRRSPVFSVGTASGTQNLKSRFVTSNKNSSLGGIMMPGRSGYNSASAGGSKPRVLRPR